MKVSNIISLSVLLVLSATNAFVKAYPGQENDVKDPEQQPNAHPGSYYAFSEEQKAEMLADTNAKRALHVDTLPLTWSDNMAEYAENFIASYNCSSGEIHHSGGDPGENLALGLTVSGAVNAWYNEIKYYDYSNPDFSDEVGHFTQLVWKDSREVGCAIRFCNNYWQSYIICEYNPSGNYAGEFGDQVMPLIEVVSSVVSSSITSTSTTSSISTSTAPTVPIATTTPEVDVISTTTPEVDVISTTTPEVEVISTTTPEVEVISTTTPEVEVISTTHTPEVEVISTIAPVVQIVSTTIYVEDDTTTLAPVVVVSSTAAPIVESVAPPMSTIDIIYTPVPTPAVSSYVPTVLYRNTSIIETKSPYDPHGAAIAANEKVGAGVSSSIFATTIVQVDPAVHGPTVYPSSNIVAIDVGTSTSISDPHGAGIAANEKTRAGVSSSIFATTIVQVDPAVHGPIVYSTSNIVSIDVGTSTSISDPHGAGIAANEKTRAGVSTQTPVVPVATINQAASVAETQPVVAIVTTAAFDPHGAVIAANEKTAPASAVTVPVAVVSTSVGISIAAPSSSVAVLAGSSSIFATTVVQVAPAIHGPTVYPSTSDVVSTSVVTYTSSSSDAYDAVIAASEKTAATGAISQDITVSPTSSISPTFGVSTIPSISSDVTSVSASQQNRVSAAAHPVKAANGVFKLDAPVLRVRTTYVTDGVVITTYTTSCPSSRKSKTTIATVAATAAQTATSGVAGVAGNEVANDVKETATVFTATTARTSSVVNKTTDKADKDAASVKKVTITNVAGETVTITKTAGETTTTSTTTAVAANKNAGKTTTAATAGSNAGETITTADKVAATDKTNVAVETTLTANIASVKTYTESTIINSAATAATPAVTTAASSSIATISAYKGMASNMNPSILLSAVLMIVMPLF